MLLQFPEFLRYLSSLQLLHCWSGDPTPQIVLVNISPGISTSPSLGSDPGWLLHFKVPFPKASWASHSIWEGDSLFLGAAMQICCSHFEAGAFPSSVVPRSFLQHPNSSRGAARHASSLPPFSGMCGEMEGREEAWEHHSLPEPHCQGSLQ